MKIKYLLGIISISSLVISCDTTDIKPLDSLTDSSYWKSVSDLKLYTNDLYDKLSAPSVEHDNASDNCVTTNYNSMLFDEQTIPASAKDAGWTWENIRSCNYFMHRYQSVSGSEADINKHVAEVRFFRALDYFGKIKAFGDVPWYDKDLKSSDRDELFKARDPRDFVLGKIMEDLNFAIEWLPDYGKQEMGRLTKDAARTQLARVCLHYGTFKKYHQEDGTPTSEQLLQKAAELSEVVINTGNYEIIKGSDAGCGQMAFEDYPLAYSNQFIQEDLTTNKECILPRIYKDGVLTHETGRQAGGKGTGLSKDFVESFLCKDGLPISVSPLYQGDETVEEEIENRDPRMYQIVDNLHKPYIVINGQRQVNPFTNCNANESVTGYPCVKYRSPLMKQAEARQTTYDWFIYRYAEVLLIHAEAKAELNQCTQDILDKTINLLRDRVEMPHLTISPVVDTKPVNYGYTVSPLLYEIRRERRIELITEGFRLDDIKRWNAMKLLENPKTMLGMRITEDVEKLYGENNITFGGEEGRPIVELNGNVYLYQYPSKQLDDAGRKWSSTDRRWLNPLPTDELQLNKNLVQNPYWGKK